MKKAAIVIFIGIFVISASTVFTQTTGPKISINLTGGPALPSGELNDGWSLGFHGGVTLDLSLKGGFTLFADGHYNSFMFDIDDWGLPANATFSGGTFGVFSLTAGGKYFFPMQSNIKVYGMAGLGLFMQSISDVTVRYRIITSWYTADVTSTWSTDSATDFGVLFGFGMHYPMSPKLSLVGEFRMVVIFTEEESTVFIPLVIGVVLYL